MHSLLLIICLLFLFEQTESIDYQFILCLQHVYICTAYWEGAKFLLEASRTRTEALERAVSMLVYFI